VGQVTVKILFTTSRASDSMGWTKNSMTCFKQINSGLGLVRSHINHLYSGKSVIFIGTETKSVLVRKTSAMVFWPD